MAFSTHGGPDTEIRLVTIGELVYNPALVFTLVGACCILTGHYKDKHRDDYDQK